MTLFLNRITSWFTPWFTHWTSKSRATHAEPERVTAQNDAKHDTQNDAQSLMPFDENLLDRSRLQWQFGDWHSLTQMDPVTLQHHPDRAKLALLSAAGHAQLGHTELARQLTRLAQNWGCNKKLISQVLISGVHNSLARAAAAAGQTQKTRDHFENTIHVGMPYLDAHLLAPARAQQQLTDMGLVAQSPLFSQSTHDTHDTHDINDTLFTHESDQNHLTALPHHSPLPPPSPFTPHITAQHSLGLAWAGNAIRILTYQGLQTTAFYVDDHTLRLVQRRLATNTLHTHDLPGHYNLQDAHNSISLGVDRAGYLHICYDHHVSHLRYRRSTAPNTITSWTDELAMTMTGIHEDQMTYPTFILPHHGYPLTLFYRDGVHGNSTARLKTYSEGSHLWADHPQAILRCAEQQPEPIHAYWNHPAIGPDGTLHLSFLGRTHSVSEDHGSNINICYARSINNGLNWTNSQGRAYQLPITQVHAETIHPVGPKSHIIPQCSMAIDSHNHPHIVFYADDANAVPQYQHLRFDGKRWHHQVISNRPQPFPLQGDGTQPSPLSPLSRPDILVDEHDNAYVIYRGDLTDNRMVATYLIAPHYTVDHTSTLWPEDVFFSEPMLDRTRWQQDHILSLLLQRNESPAQPITLVDISFKTNVDHVQKP